jgi:putative tryptophan/tyrosine transport system substrate-binding protein
VDGLALGSVVLLSRPVPSERLRGHGGQASPRRQAGRHPEAIVAFTDDLVGAGLVASYARPGGNITGISILSSELNAKRLEILKEVSPGNSRVAVLWDPAAGTAQLKAMEIASRSLGVRLLVLEVRGPADLDGAFKIANKEGAGAVNVLASPLLASYSEKIVALAAESRLPAIYQWREHAEAGGLISYGPILLETWRQTGHIVGKVLRGAKPADLPVELPTNFELVINAKTAKTLGLTIPPSLLSRAHDSQGESRLLLGMPY